MMRYVLPILAVVGCTFAQTHTDCNPTKKICPVDPALGTSFNETFYRDSSISSHYWTTLGSAGPEFPMDNSGAAFTVAKPNDGPLLQSQFYMFWGHVEVIMKAAPGQGIISSIVLLSDDLDEIDWEVMGGNTTHVETNYYGKGDQTQINSIYYPCDSPQTGAHNYTINWSSEKVEWILDTKVVRTLKYDNAVKDGKSIFPQTPMHLKIGSWAGGDSRNAKGTITWAGGLTDYSKGPYSMRVHDIRATDGTTNATQYSYGDLTGSFESIQIKHGISRAQKAINAPPPLTAKQRWNKIPKGGQIAIIAVVLGIASALALLYLVFCVKQRRAGHREKLQADMQWEKEQMEVAEWKKRAQDGSLGPLLGKAPGVRVEAVGRYQ